MQPRVLIAIPYHEKKRYALDRCLEAVRAMTYPNKEVLMRWDLGEYGGKDNVKIQRETFRNIAITFDFDYLFFLGVDTIPPPDVIERLLTANEPIVGGVYWGRHAAENGHPDGAVAWIHNQTPEKQQEMFNPEPGKAGLVRVDGMGMDCVLFKREVFFKLSWLSWEQNDDDYPYYDQAKAAGYRIYVDTSVQCRHYSARDCYTFRGETILGPH